jgi:hypothetical protein
MLFVRKLVTTLDNCSLLVEDSRGLFLASP